MAENTTEQKTVSKDVVDAIHLLAQGKRNMMCLEISQAVQQFQEACKILGSEYGETADECADAYYWYGRSLLEMSRLEGGVLGDQVNTESEESQSEDDSEEKTAEKSEDKKNGEETGGEEEGDEEEEEGDLSEDIEEDEEGEMMGKKGKGAKKEVSCGAGATEEGEKQVNGDKAHAVTVGEETAATCDSSQNDVPDDISNLQLAWETMELAKVIYSRREGRDMKLKLAEAYLRLGEIGLETEQYDQAIADLNESLSILRSNLAPEDRKIAETLYQLGVACTLNKQYDTAVRHYRAAVEVLENKMRVQRAVVSGEIQPKQVVGPDGSVTTEGVTDGFYSVVELAAQELEEMAAIIPEILARIDDVIDEQRNADKVRLLMRESVPTSNHAPSFPSTQSSSSESASSAADQAASVFSQIPCLPDQSSEANHSVWSLGKPATVVGDGTSQANVNVFSGFSFQSSGSFSSSSTTAAAQPINNITHLIRKKRKSDETEKTTEEAKRSKTEAITTSTTIATSAANGSCSDKVGTEDSVNDTTSAQNIAMTTKTDAVD